MAEPHRIQAPGYESNYGDGFGAFRIPYRRTGVTLVVIATDGDYRASGVGAEYAWEHVSVSLPNRCPNWLEMDFIKDIFWDATETVMQLHVPKADHRNLAETCLHLWRPLNAEIPRPPSLAVAP